MSKLPELRASARAAAAAPLATDRLALAMLMTGALVSDATRGAPGRRERRMRRAQLSIGVWVAERCIAGKRWVAPRTVELEAEDQSREERHVGGGTIWLAVRRTKLRRTVLARVRSLFIYPFRMCLRDKRFCQRSQIGFGRPGALPPHGAAASASLRQGSGAPPTSAAAAARRAARRRRGIARRGIARSRGEAPHQTTRRLGGHAGE
jgi:hypothetical protein